MKKLISLLMAITMLAIFVAGCTTNNNTKDVDLEDVHATLKEELGEDYYPSEEMNLDMIADITGLSADDIETYIAEAPLMNLSIDTFIAIKAKEGKGEAVEAGLEKYKKYYQEEAFLYPMNMPKANAARVVRYGDYVFFLMFGKHDDRVEATEEEMLEFAEAEIDRIQEIIDKFFK